MKLPYGYVLDGEKIVIHEERAEAHSQLGKGGRNAQNQKYPFPIW